MNNQNVQSPVILQPEALLSYEFIFTDKDFLISLNGACKPSACEGFFVDGNGCFVLRQALGEFISLPMPAAFTELVAASDEILFVQFSDGKPADAKALPRCVAVIH